MKQTKLWLITMVVLLCSLTASAHDFEVDGIYYFIIPGPDLTVAVTYKGSSYSSYSDEYSGAVTIPSVVTYNGITYSVVSIGHSAFYNCSSLSSITIPEGVTSIGGRAFHGTAWYNSQSDGVIYLDSWLIDYKGTMPYHTSIEVKEGTVGIGYEAFYNCSSLTSITIPEGVTSIGYEAFAGCSSLSSITVEEENSAYDSRNDCNAIIETSSNTLILGCSTTIIPKGVTSIGDQAFCNCFSLTSIAIPESVTSIGDYAFDDCTLLKEVIFEDGSETLTLGYNDSSLGQGLFYDCPLEKVYLGRNLSYNRSPFYNKTELASLIIGGDVTCIEGRAFEGCTGELVLNCNIPSASESSFSIFNGSKFTEVTIGEGVTDIGDYAFYDCSSLAAVNLSKDVTNIGDYAFYGCTGLTAINFSASVTNIGDYAFYKCTDLTTINLSERVTCIGKHAFQRCNSLTSITSKAVTPPAIGDNNTFRNVDKSIPVYVPANSVADYQAAEGWEEFTNFVGVETVIEKTTDNGQQTTVIYDLMGRKILDTENLKGGIYIVNGRKITIND